MHVPDSQLAIFPLPVAEAAPDRCHGVIPTVTEGGQPRRCKCRGVHAVAGVTYCRHHLPRDVIRYDSIPNMKATARFAGVVETHADHVRLVGQLERIFSFMRAGAWHTLTEISAATRAPHASVSAQLRNLRKPEWGAHTVERRSVGDGLHEYRLIPNPKVQMTLETKSGDARAEVAA